MPLPSGGPSSGSVGMASFLSGGAAAALGGLGQVFTNRSNRREARRNREFQLYMSNTAVQRRMEDMRKAGINPILAARFDASTPPGAMATMQNAGKAAVDSGVAGVTSALAIKRQAQELENMKAQVEVSRADAEQKRQQTQLIQIQQRLVGYSADVKEGAAFLIQSLLGLLPNEIRNDPAKVGAWVKPKIQGFITEHADSIQHARKFISDVVSIITSMADTLAPDRLDAATIEKGADLTRSTGRKFYQIVTGNPVSFMRNLFGGRK